jgi:NADPH:quinone reductase-like Zn-dependent oxidoreductase
LALLAINPPTAALLLSEYVTLNPGDWVVQNAANSGVGRWVIAFARTRGLKTVNIVRRPELVAELEAIGGDVVVVDSPDVPERIKAAELRLALDGISGPATGVLAATLSPRLLVCFVQAPKEEPEGSQQANLHGDHRKRKQPVTHAPDGRQRQQD